MQLLVKNYAHLKKNIIIGKSFSEPSQLNRYKDDNTNLIHQPGPDVMKNTMEKSYLALTAAGQVLCNWRSRKSKI